MVKLVVCPRCSAHVFASESSCPHCGAARTGPKATARQSGVAAIVLGLALSGCGADDASDDNATTASTESATTNASSTGDTAITGQIPDPDSGPQTAAYGTPDSDTFGTTDMTDGDTDVRSTTGTGGDTSTGGDTDTDTDGSTGGTSTSTTTSG